MSLFKKKKNRRVCVVGLDGVPHSLLLDFCGRGIMPAMAKLVAAGRLHRMKASLPEISAVSWTDFMTGTNSGTHGVFGFTDFKPGSYELRFPNYQDVRAETIWDALGRRGRKSIVINQPSTYPARPLNGVLVSGFVALDLAKAVYPAAQKLALETMGYQIDIDTQRAREDHDVLWRDLDKTMSGRQKALNYFWGDPWDYFELVITGTDRLHHYLWDAGQDPAHPDHARFLDYYRRVDRIIERVADNLKQPDERDPVLYLLSDHGFTGLELEVNLNAWLEQEGYLAFETPAPKSLGEIAPGSRAFALDPNRIYLNLKGKFPKGSVDPDSAPALREEIRAKLERLEHAGRRVVHKVFAAEDAYSGPLTGRGPDLLAVSATGFDFKGSTRKKEVFTETNLRGMHTWDDAFFWAAEDHGDDLKISDLAA
ncbi:MAG: alkaline phosphatase family protein, partial [Candidatus Aminicenantes bacterium]|nr:alkaline phosphatase family protein [Candidatus Aminicenantes bacterium]